MNEEKRIEAVHKKVMDLIRITNEMEELYPERSFKLDGILLGNIGEILAAYHYGLKLFKQSVPTHDGEVIADGRKVQVKITQSNSIVLREKMDYLLVLHLNRSNGEVTELYNGSGGRIWENARYEKQMNHYSLSVPKLLQLREQVTEEERVKQVHVVKKYERKNAKK